MTTPQALQRRFVTGPEAVQAVRSLSKVEDRRDAWPYPWVFPPKGAIRVRASGTIVAPAAATQTLVLAYTVPTGFWFALTRIVQVYTGAGFVAGSGDITWVLDKNIPVGFPLVMGSPIQGFGSETVPLGSFQIPWILDMPEILQASDTVRSKVTTTANIIAGVPNYLTSMFLGWLCPAE